jgi:hypothetical protein
MFLYFNEAYPCVVVSIHQLKPKKMRMTCWLESITTTISLITSFLIMTHL